MGRSSRARCFYAAILCGAAAAGTAGAALGPGGGAAGGGATSTDVVLLASYVLLALVFSFLCSVAEAVLLSITPSYIAGLREANPKRAALLKRLKQDDVDQSLAAILTLNTIAHTVGAIGSGAKATVVFGSAWFGLFSAVMTLLILFLSEIVPKTLGAVHWRSLAGWTALFVRSLVFVLYPLIWVSEKITRWIARGRPVHAFSREEFVALAGIGEQTGAIGPSESRIIRNLFRLGSLTASDVMTPRTVISALPREATVAQVLEGGRQLVFSRLPIYGAGIDDVTGFVLKDDLLLHLAEGKGEVRLGSLQRELPTVSGDTPLSGLLEFLLDQRQHIARVIDVYGGTKGLVTLEDAVETLLGMEIVDELDTVEDMQALARQQWEKRARSIGLDLGEQALPAPEAGGSQRGTADLPTGRGP